MNRKYNTFFNENSREKRMTLFMDQYYTVRENFQLREIQ